ncbi:MAG: nucleotidyl transferase AbiEii/AbiGii toxin family protein [Paracoccaceae bacterium]|nr:nucleotidyl transferase AbiEii/AbiGii toxin family protein [Paracoccaceae bacterium]MDE2916691.1 nucleotidyl transferase AbiEii/AbiGii toxin family protein [Paracoccaceae bacterium]
MNVHYFSLNLNQKREILNTYSANMGKQPDILEKDIWICWVLQILFSNPKLHSMVFKGGTSLSKCYGIINRFSEDVDITLDYKGFQKDFNPFNETKTQINKKSNAIKAQVEEYIENTIRPFLENEVKKLNISNQEGCFSTKREKDKLYFHYPRIFSEESGYLKPEVLLEFGGRNSIIPNEDRCITPDIAKEIPHLSFPKARVKVLSPSRTFWEKATLIHAECNRDRDITHINRLSRHWYDLVQFKTHDSGERALKNRELLKDVIKYKNVFFSAKYNHFDDCLNGNFKLVPNERLRKELEEDYRKMCEAGMILKSPIPDFDDLMGIIKLIEEEINSGS